MTVSTGIITTIAGSSTSGSYSGDNGPATSATLNGPAGVALDSVGNSLIYSFCLTCFSQLFLPYLGNVYIGDQPNNRIRKMTVSTGIITTVAGSSTSGSYSGDDGQATAAGLNNPVGVALDSAGTHSSLLF